MTDIVERLRISAKDWKMEGEMSGGERWVMRRHIKNTFDVLALVGLMFTFAALAPLSASAGAGNWYIALSVVWAGLSLWQQMDSNW